MPRPRNRAEICFRAIDCIGGMKKHVRAKLNKRGVTIAEAVVAMAVIIAVSAAAIACIEAFSKTSANMNGKNEAVILCENALEVFKGTDTYNSYRGIRGRFLKYTPSGVSDYEDYPSLVVENYEIPGCTVQIDLKYNSEEQTASFSAVVRDTKNRKVFEIDEYKKAITIAAAP